MHEIINDRNMYWYSPQPRQEPEGTTGMLHESKVLIGARVGVA